MSSLKRRLTQVAMLVVMLVVALSVVTSASARPVPPEGPETTLDILIRAGYDCSRMGSGGWMCTKKDGGLYYCDNSGACMSAFIPRPTPSNPVNPNERVKLTP